MGIATGTLARLSSSPIKRGSDSVGRDVVRVEAMLLTVGDGRPRPW